MSDKIGILGGISPASTIKYYQRLVELYNQNKNDMQTPEILLYSLDFQKFTLYENTDRSAYIKYISRGLQLLEQGGANPILMAANSPYSVYSEIVNTVQCPILHICEPIAKRANHLNMDCLLLLGIKHTMQNRFYADFFESYDISIITPVSNDQEIIESIIFNELVFNKIHVNSRNIIENLISTYDVDGVILGCTELPLLLHEENSDITYLDSMELHVNSSLKWIENRNTDLLKTNGS